MKKIIMFLTLFSSLTFSKVFPYLDGNFKAKVIENSVINNVKKNKVYDVSYSPSKMELKVLEPALNKGEIYTYSKSGKTLYSPKLKQTVKQSITGQDESIYSILSELSSLETATTQNKGHKKYIFENSILRKIEAKDYTVEFENFSNNKPTNIISTLFTKEHGKISAINYGIKKSKSRNLSAIMPLSLVEVEMNNINENYSITDIYLSKQFRNILNNINKLELGLYILHVFNDILEYNTPEDYLFYRNFVILVYIDNIDDLKLEDELYFYSLILIYLRRMMVELGIFDLELILDNNTKLLYNKYLLYIKGEKVIEVYQIKMLINVFEKYINSYFSTKIRYNKILI